MKLVVIIQPEFEQAWLTPLDLPARGIDLVLLRPSDAGVKAEDAAGQQSVELIVNPADLGEETTRLPNFRAVVDFLHRAQPTACLILQDGVLSRLTLLAANLLGLSVFWLVTTRAQLESIGREAKARPDLLFVADLDLFDLVINDERYGSTLLPTGHPARDLALLVDGGADAVGADPRYGDGQAGLRIREAIERWRDDRLAPETPDLSVVVPCYKEAGNLELVCDRLLAVLESQSIAAEILLVDDASPDDTLMVARQQMWRSPRIRAITKPLPRGMGNAIKHGVTQARAPVIAITMGDGSDDVERIPEMFRRIASDGYGLVIGSRYRYRHNYENIPHLYRMWSRFFRIVAAGVTGMKLRDYTNAFRVFHRRVVERYGLESGGFEISPELTFKAWYATRRVTEVDVRHLKRASGQSNFSFMRAGPGYGKILIKAMGCRLTGRWFNLDW